MITEQNIPNRENNVSWIYLSWCPLENKVTQIISVLQYAKFQVFINKMRFCNMDASGCKKVEIRPKSAPHPKGQVMLVKCENTLSELTIQFWLLHLNLNFRY